MSTAPVKIGIDDRGRFFYVARVRQDAGRPMVEALARFERSLVRSHPILEAGELLFAVADDMVRVSDLQLSGSGQFQSEQLARFEQFQSLLDDETEFCLDTMPLGADGDRSLGLAVRRARLSELVRPFTASVGVDLAKAQFALRAEALGQGFLSFGRGAPGEFICLIDFNDRLVSVCFIYKKKILGVAHLVTKPFDLTSPTDFERMTIELKTVVNFKLAAFSRQSVSVPLSALIVSGSGQEKHALEILKKYFSVQISEVGISSGFFPQPDRISQIPAGEYLVALGLTSLKRDRFQ